jgi:tRNA-dihydrouridine synthase A
MDSYMDLAGFVETVANAGCTVFIIHARKAWLKGLSPKENRTVPPLKYEYAWQLKKDFPHLSVVVNGGITDLDAAALQLQHADGVMLGRAAYHDPYLLADVDRRFFADPHPVPSRVQVVEAMLPYIERELSGGASLKQITRHMLGLFHGMPGARHWRRHLSQFAVRPDAGTDVVRQALDFVMDFTSGETLTGDVQQHG